MRCDRRLARSGRQRTDRSIRQVKEDQSDCPDPGHGRFVLGRLVEQQIALGRQILAHPVVAGIDGEPDPLLTADEKLNVNVFAVDLRLGLGNRLGRQVDDLEEDVVAVELVAPGGD